MSRGPRRGGPGCPRHPCRYSPSCRFLPVPDSTAVATSRDRLADLGEDLQQDLLLQLRQGREILRDPFYVLREPRLDEPLPLVGEDHELAAMVLPVPLPPDEALLFHLREHQGHASLRGEEPFLQFRLAEGPVGEKELRQGIEFGLFQPVVTEELRRVDLPEKDEHIRPYPRLDRKFLPRHNGLNINYRSSECKPESGRGWCVLRASPRTPSEAAPAPS